MLSAHRCGPSFIHVTASAPRRNDPVGLQLRVRARIAGGGAAPVEAVRPLELPGPAAAAAGHRPQQGRPEQAVAEVLGCYSVVS